MVNINLIKYNHRLTWFGVLIICVLIHHFFGFNGHYGYDDMWYAKVAHGITNGQLDLQSDHYAYRWTLIFPLALVYEIFGINDHSSGMVSIGYFIGILFLMYRLIKNQDFFVLASSFVVFNGWLLYYSDKIMPDIALVFFLFAAFYQLYQQRYVRERKHYLRAFLFSLMIFLAFITKGTVLLMIPVFGFIALIDLWRNRNRRFWWFSLGCMMLLLFFYFGLLYLLTGDGMIRFKTITSNSYFNKCSYDQLPLIETIRRIGYQFWDLLLKSDMLASIVWLIPMVFVILFLKRTDVNSRLKFLITISLTLLIVANFMTISATGYVPMCPDPRHFMYFIPITAVSGIYILQYLLDKDEHYLYMFIPTALLAILSLLLGYTGSAIVMSAYAVLFLIRLLGLRFQSKYMYLLLILPLFVQPVRIMIKSSEGNYSEQKALIIDQIKPLKKETIVVTNHAQSTIGNYLLEFDNSHVRFITHEEFIRTKHKSNVDYLLLKNGKTRVLSNTTHSQLPKYAQKANDLFECIYRGNNLTLFKMDESKLSNTMEN